VTAYYSPLPDQKYYLKWNYKDEIRLNGRWIAWASWKRVYSGMLAAPKNYKFGTKIYLEWLWIGSVEDRGWAIVNAGNRGYKSDRIDVWMWYGDEWLARALYWGKRKVKWSIVSSYNKETIDYKNIPAPAWVFNSLEQTPNIFYKSIWKKSNKNDIYDLKLFLHDNNFYNWEVNYEYTYDLITLIHEFQLKHKLVSKDEILWAGYWWKKTREKFLEEYRLWKLETKNNDNVIVEYNDNIESSKELYNNVLLKWDIKYIFNNPVKSIVHIAELQNVMKELEIYSWEVDWKYDSIQEVLLQYQLENNLIVNKDSLWAWYYGPKTRKTLYQDYIEYLDYKEKLKKAENNVSQIKDISYNQAETKIKELWNLSIWNVSPQVRDLQLILKHFWYFDDKDTAIFWNKTKQAIISMQLDREIITNKNSIWAWVYWPNTKKELIKLLSEYYFQEEFNKLNLDEKIISDLKKSSTI
jgi:3D (Asp-Asp-Asp) domain-containing protein